MIQYPLKLTRKIHLTRITTKLIKQMTNHLNFTRNLTNSNPINIQPSPNFTIFFMTIIHDTTTKNTDQNYNYPITPGRCPQQRNSAANKGCYHAGKKAFIPRHSRLLQEGYDYTQGKYGCKADVAFFRHYRIDTKG